LNAKEFVEKYEAALADVAKDVGVSTSTIAQNIH